MQHTSPAPSPFEFWKSVQSFDQLTAHVLGVSALFPSFVKKAADITHVAPLNLPRTPSFPLHPDFPAVS